MTKVFVCLFFWKRNTALMKHDINKLSTISKTHEMNINSKKSNTNLLKDRGGIRCQQGNIFKHQFSVNTKITWPRTIMELTFISPTWKYVPYEDSLWVYYWQFILSFYSNDIETFCFWPKWQYRVPLYK